MTNTEANAQYRSKVCIKEIFQFSFIKQLVRTCKLHAYQPGFPLRLHIMSLFCEKDKSQ